MVARSQSRRNPRIPAASGRTSPPQGRCEPIVNSLRHYERQLVSVCNVCGSDRNAIVAQPDRYGPARTAMCLNCGLFFLMDRLTDEGYSEFYKSGTCRRLVSAFTSAKQAIEEIQTDQVHYANGLIQALHGYLKFPRGARLLDVEGSAGQVALGSDWQEWGRSASDPRDWLRRKAYKLKRTLIRNL
jgi:hypothetical protein